MSYLGIDWGSKRLGLAYADEGLGIAFPMPAIIYETQGQLWVSLKNVIERKEIKCIVLGYPLNMDETEGPRTQTVKSFCEKLKTHFQVPVILSDERLTTYAVHSVTKKRSMQAQKAERKTGDLDSRAAALILQDYLDEFHHKQELCD